MALRYSGAGWRSLGEAGKKETPMGTVTRFFPLNHHLLGDQPDPEPRPPDDGGGDEDEG